MAGGSPGSLLEVQNLDLWNQNVHFKKVLGDLCAGWSERSPLWRSGAGEEGSSLVQIQASLIHGGLGFSENILLQLACPTLIREEFPET